MKISKIVLMCAFCLCYFILYSQKKTYMARTVAFYNVENLFDTINNPLTFDDDRTPNGKDRWTSQVYKDHVNKIAHVISKIGADITRSTPDFVGLAEIENREVIVDLVKTPHLSKGNYGIVHFDSPDSRGIDVAFIYKKAVFKPTHVSVHPLKIYKPDGKRLYTRDQLLVSGNLAGEEIHFIVNHWPSRSGGKGRSAQYREQAAALNKKIIDSLLNINPQSKIISMGDFNDDATDDSFKKILKTIADKDKVGKGQLYNPMENMFKQGKGTLAYQKQWNLFDQIFFTEGLLNASQGYSFWKAAIFKDKMLLNESGDYKGLPFRSYVNGMYTGGYSDHLPVYIILVKEKL